jgi:spore coat-associated protein N
MKRARHFRSGSTLSRKLLLTLGAVGTAASMAGLGSFATFTSSTNASQSVGSGTVVIGLGATGAATNRLTVAASGLVPGDTMQRSVDLSNTGNQNLASLTLTTTATPSTLLTTDATNGLQIVVDRCSTTWTEAGSSPAFTYTCGGSLTTIVTTRAVIGANMTLAGLSALTAAGTDHLRVTLTFPTTADNTFQGLSTTITYAFTATQRAGTNQ